MEYEEPHDNEPSGEFIPGVHSYWLFEVLNGLGFNELLRERTTEALQELGLSENKIDSILEEISFKTRDQGEIEIAHTAESLRVLLRAMLGREVYPWDPEPQLVVRRIYHFLLNNGESQSF